MIIGLCGRAGSGKTSVAEYLEEKHGAKRFSFAAPLKRIAMDIWGFSEKQVYGDAKIKETVDPVAGVSPRSAMQMLGQAARDHLGKDIWIKGAMDQARSTSGLRIIEDVRYCNEAAYIHGYGGYIWRLHCSDSISKDAGTHPSESEVDKIPSAHVTFEVCSSRQQGLPHLFRLVDQVLGDLRARN